jgi:hypothetical protein
VAVFSTTIGLLSDEPICALINALARKSRRIMMRIIVRENRRAMDYLGRPWSKFGNPEPPVFWHLRQRSPTCGEGSARARTPNASDN